MENTCPICEEPFSAPPGLTIQVCDDCADDYSTCDYCGIPFKTNGTPYCNNCLPDFNQCDKCSNWHSSDELNFIEGEENNVCDDCLDRYYFTCHSCQVTYNNMDSYGDSICEDCFIENYFTCEECGGTYTNDYYAQDDLCQECYGDKPDLYPHSYKPIPIFHGISNPYYGIELETDLYDDVCSAAEKLKDFDYRQENFYLKEDGSLSRDGIEIVFHPRNFNSWWEYDLQQILSLVRDNGGRSFHTDTCGIHIHRSNRDLSTVTKIKLILFFGFCSEQIITLAQRKTNFARFVLFKGMPDKGVCYKTMKKGTHTHEKFQAINFGHSDTIEFRVFKGTLKLSTIMAYLTFCHYIVDFCKGTLLHEFIEGSSLWGKFVESLKCQKNEMVINLCEYLKNKKLM